MKALGILGGPRKGHTTDHLLDSALQGLKDRGAETEKIYLYDLNIKPCLSCLACSDTKKCVIQDDEQIVLDKIADSDVIVFSSPTYWSNIPSQAKAFIDRSGSLFVETKYGPKRLLDKPSKAILLTSCWAPFPFSHLYGISSGCIKAMKVFFDYMPRVKVKTFTAAGILQFDEKKCAKALRKAYILGKTI